MKEFSQDSFLHKKKKKSLLATNQCVSVNNELRGV